MHRSLIRNRFTRKMFKEESASHSDEVKKSGIVRSLVTIGIATSSVPMLSVAAFAQATAGQNTIGGQLNTMSSEAMSAGGNAGTMGMYVAALICFVFGVWKIWQSRQPENREGGQLAAGIAGIVLCGLFATGPTWINKAANTTAGANASVGNNPAMVTFQ